MAITLKLRHLLAALALVAVGAGAWGVASCGTAGPPAERYAICVAQCSLECLRELEPEERAQLGKQLEALRASEGAPLVAPHGGAGESSAPRRGEGESPSTRRPGVPSEPGTGPRESSGADGPLLLNCRDSILFEAW